MFKRVLDLDVKNAYAANGIGMVLAELGHREKAAKIFSAVNEATPNMLQSRVNLAHLHMSYGRYSAACQLYELCADRCSAEKKAEYLTFLARAQTSAGMADPEKFDSALATLEKIEAVTPDDVNLGFNRAIVQYNFSNCILAKAQVESKQKDVDHKHTLIYYTRSWIQRAKEMMETALGLFEEAKDAVERAGDDASAQGFLFSSKETKERAKLLEKILADSIPVYLAYAEKEDKKEEAARLLAQKKLADQERQEAAARREDK
jgi:tetratricopeptide (TPR) repeat protein